MRFINQIRELLNATSAALIGTPGVN